MARALKCPKCKSTNVEVISQKTRTSLNLNPLHPLTLVNHKQTGKAKAHCLDCGRVFEAKL